MLSLCFPEEITGDGVMVDSTEMIDGVVSHDEYRDEMDMMTMSQITSIVQLQPVSAFDMFGVSTIEVFEGTQTLPVPELPEDDSSLFEGIVSPVEGASDLVDPPLSFDVLSGFVSRSDDVSVASFMDLSIFEYSPASCDSTSISAPHSPTSQIFDINDEVAWPDSDRDSSDHDSDPVDERVSPDTGDVETVDFGTEDQPRELKIGSPLSTEERDRLIHLLRSYLDVFAWSYEDMPGLDPSIVQHHLPILPHVRPVKQKLRRLHPRWSLQVKEEIQKQLSVGFISVVEYPEWLANVVPVPKKDGKVRVCVDFRDLNKASPKDDFPLPHIDLLVDSTAGHSMLSFMDGFSGYNQILMAPEDMEKTAFITEWGTYCYRDVEVYVDDMIVKSRGRADHLDALERFFERIGIRLRLNPKKCTFGVTSGKLLGHMVSDRGIEVDPDKIKAILDMPVPRTEKEIRGFLGRLQYISRFIARLTDICEPIFRLLRKNQPTVWNDDCQIAFEKIKEYLLSPPVLVPPMPGRPLLLYLSLEYLFDRPALTGRLMRWLVLLTEFDIQSTSATNNIVEYEACILGLETALELGIRQMEVFSDSNLVLRQIQEIGRLGIAQNQFADALATLASSVDIPIDVVIPTAKDRRALRHLATRFVICGDTLYRRSADGMLLLCLDRASADRVMREVHSGVCECQIHGDLIHAPPSELHALTSPWPFSVWEGALPSEVDTLLTEVCYPNHRSSAYRPQTNGPVEAANKNIKRILRKMVETSPRLVREASFYVVGISYIFRTSTGATPYSLVYGWRLFCQSRQRWLLRVALEQ
ncbi:Transposon Ty3-I Gag-Pol polyprotein [Vitis vinifera]|uniref:Transposon Ty3-I Gag-Pol polyprotein n=1 Tax=Vitis vinifera TaxID=29760 RepID=A0A438FPC3_VITVI|nr:Transposon Ty3-I Gag-Pol polyprotein [Vitis vinifera]